jgi:serine/threonine protein kinase
MEDYEEVRRIGKGSEGSVYLVKHRRTQQLFVVKKIFIRSSAAQASNEAKILSQVGAACGGVGAVNIVDVLTQ